MSQKHKAAAPKAVYLKDYRPPSHRIEHVDLDVALDPTRTRVRAKLKIRTNDDPAAPRGPLKLDGSHFELQSVHLNGRVLPRDAYEANDAHLTLHNPPAGAFTLETVTIVDAESNKALQGLYRSGGVYCTQCEAEGFRRITYMLDRPDVLATYRVRLEAPVKDAPVLLANGNLVERGTLGGGKHYAVWEDPHPKPCYLFALVAGDLGSIASEFVTMSGRKVDLRIYVEHGKEARAAWAMDALKRSMAWDEKRFGREYDLECFNIVAVSDFNMGAMENKGLNIFNDRLILASAETATDANFEAIESVVAHEYFHNWTGNRITCRDWFQLCLKEGLTVFRDQEFSSDERSRTVQRITDVRVLKAAQFPEDAGPLAHPVRPEQYIEINNFYTATVYEKGAEVVRMLQTVLGEAAFGAGLDLYFTRHDGEAATVEQFVKCFEDAAERDLQPFMEWYRQAGTPHVTAEATYDAKAKALELTFTQAAPKAGKGAKAPLRPIPVRLGLIARDGHEERLKLATGDALPGGVALLSKPKETLTFTGLSGRPAVSLLRSFSAPVVLKTSQSDRELAFLAAHDSDRFNRWQSARTLAERQLLTIYKSLVAGKQPSQSAILPKAIAVALAEKDLEPAFGAELLRLPGVADLMQAVSGEMGPGSVDPEIAIRAQRLFARRLGRALGDELERAYQKFKPKGAFSPDAASAGRRAIRNAALSLLAARGTEADVARVAKHYDDASNMTDQAHALALLAQLETPARGKALADFEKRWSGDDLVIDTWFTVQAQSLRPGAFEEITALVDHPRFKLTTPNKVRALIGTFAHQNPRHFHRPDGRGYAFVVKNLLAIDDFNPQVASRLATCFRTWRGLTPALAAKAKAALTEIAAHPKLSRDVREMVERMLS